MTCDHERVKVGVNEDYCGDCGQPPIHVPMENPCREVVEKLYIGETVNPNRMSSYYGVFAQLYGGKRGGTSIGPNQQDMANWKERKENADSEQADIPYVVQESGDKADDFPKQHPDREVLDSEGGIDPDLQV